MRSCGLETGGVSHSSETYHSGAERRRSGARSIAGLKLASWACSLIAGWKAVQALSQELSQSRAGPVKSSLGRSNRQVHHPGNLVVFEAVNVVQHKHHLAGRRQLIDRAFQMESIDESNQ